MFDRPSNALAFMTILAVCTAGALHAPMWAAVAGAGLLVLISLSKAWGARVVADGRSIPDAVQFAASSLNGAAAAAAAFGLGHVTTWVWGI